MDASTQTAAPNNQRQDARFWRQLGQHSRPGLRYRASRNGADLRGIFLCRRADIDYFFQGNAAQFAADPLAMPAPGAYLDFPTAWRHFVDVIPPEDRGDVVKGGSTFRFTPTISRAV